MPEKLEIEALRAVLAIVEHGGITRAAEHLGLSQSAVSHKIRRLEQTLDCSLLTRRAGGPLFTDAGMRLTLYANRLVDLHDEALAELGKKPLLGSIRLGMTEDASTSAFAKALGRFTRLYPTVNVRTRTGQSLVVQNWLKAGELDAAIMQVFQGHVSDDDHILFEDQLYWVKSPDLALDPTEPVPFLSFDEHCFYRQWGFGEGQSRGHRFEMVLECPSAAGIQSAVRAGLGIALLNGLHVTPDMEVIEGVLPTPPGLTFIARIHRKSRTPAVKTLISEVARTFHATPGLQKAG
ncbi:LysR family transcriptional regulator [Alisedimentitalea sp. MJ-SS2]|uniref:LysR family transcriptional regulator n=1 Tax=Aliisedimentitalea sp. MJ-SS2 TaxID=3049795 RepID=UPI002913FB23|nr:LysR family transcriptional regulator [Alisedimentitalea sp. MJ-SS2]MDU8928545.1 LysR family transcriptional regulator [Alisedimentitalea sp. MJ-SS2]